MRLFILFVTLAAFSVTFLPSVAHSQEKALPSGQQKAMPEKMKRMEKVASAVKMRMELRLDMRKLWEDHVMYTSKYIASALAGLGDADAVAQRLLKNQDDIGNAIKPFYGNDAGTKLSSLLRNHILLAADVVKAAKAGDNDALGKAQAKWTENADEIASFLSGANPNWTKEKLQEMLHKHLELTTAECVARIKMDWPGAIKAYDDGHEHILKLADALTWGIEKQFPDKFKK